MNLKLRRTLSSFLAFVMLCSCMVVANVGNVFAASYVYELNSTHIAEMTDLVTAGKYGTDDYFSIQGTVNKSGSALRYSGSGSVSFTTGNAATVELSLSSTSTTNTTYFTLTDETDAAVDIYKEDGSSAMVDNTIASVEGNQEQTFNCNVEAGKSYTLNKTTYSNKGSNINLFSIKVTESTDDAGEEPVPPVAQNTYTWLASVRDNTSVNAIFGGSQADTYATMGPIQKDNVATFTDNVFGITGNINGQRYISIDSKDKFTFTPQVSGTMKLYLTNSASTDSTTERGITISSASDGTQVQTGTMYAITATTPIAPIEFDVTAGTEYVMNLGGTAYMYAATLTTEEVANVTYPVTFNLKDEFGVVVTGATVTVTAEGGTTYTAEETTAGTYVANVGADEHIIALSITNAPNCEDHAETFETVISSATTRDIELSNLRTTITVSGTVTDDSTNTPVANANVTINFSNGENGLGTINHTTDESGNYSATYAAPDSMLSGLTANFVVAALGYKTANASAELASGTTAITQNIAITLNTIGTGTVYEHRFDTDGLIPSADDSGVFNFDFTGNNIDNNSVTSNGVTYSSGVKFESNTTNSFTVTTGANGGTLKVVYYSNGNTGKSLTISDGITSENVSADSEHVITYQLEAGKTYTVSRKDSASLYYIGFMENGSTGALNFTLSGTVVDAETKAPISNAVVVTNVGNRVTTNDSGEFTITGVTAATVVNAEATGYSTFRGTTTYSENTSGITIELTKKNTTTVTFSINGGNAAYILNISSNNETKSIQNDGTTAVFNDVTPGTIFKIKADGSEGNVASWTTLEGNKDNLVFVNGSGATNRYFNYIVPANLDTTKSYGVTFNVNSDAAISLNANDTNINNSGILTFGEYGFGADKTRVCGNDARDFVKYSFVTPTLADYRSGYADTDMNSIDPAGSPGIANEYGILKQNVSGSYVEFTVPDNVKNDAGGACYAYIDRTGKISVNGGSVAVDTVTVNGKSRARFEITAGATYTITSAEGTTYIKSIRIYNPNNVFKVIDADDLGTVASVIAEHPALAAELGLTDTANNTTHIVRVISQIILPEDSKTSVDVAKVAVEELNSVGFDIYNKSEYDLTKGRTTGNVWWNENHGTEDVAVPELRATITFDDYINPGVEDDLTNELLYGHETLTDPTDFYCQTFLATTQDLTLVPWCTRDTGNSIEKIYSTVNYDSANESNCPNLEVILNS